MLVEVPINCKFGRFGFKGLATQWMGPTTQAGPFLATPTFPGRRQILWDPDAVESL